MTSPLRWRPLAGAALVLTLGAVLTRAVLANPPTEPRASDVKKAERVAPSPRGQDDRVPIVGGKLVGGNGLVEPAERETKVAASVPGRIEKYLVHEGDRVEADAPLVQLDQSVEKAALDAAEADLNAARAEQARAQHGQRREEVEASEAEAQSARARAELSAGTLARTEALAKGGAATPDELDRARRQAASDQMTFRAADARRQAAAAGSRREDIDLARARALAAQARREQARAALDRLTVRAPIAGEVLQIKLRPGEYASPGGADPLLILGDTRILRVRLDIDERDIGKVRPGAPAFALADAFPGEKFAGKVVQIGRRMGRKNLRTDDPTERIDTKILEVLVELERADRLVPGLRVLGYIEAP